jgi:hypothetical protein
LGPGEAYYSVLEVEGAEVVRRDYCAAAWQGPPDGALGWWESRMPADDSAKPKLAPSEVALELFDRWSDAPEHSDARYILALFLVRKRVFRFSESAFESPQDARETLQLYCPSRAADYDVEVMEVAPARATEIQDQLVQLLYSDAA